MRTTAWVIHGLSLWLVLSIMGCVHATGPGDSVAGIPPEPPGSTPAPQIWFGPLDPEPPNANRPYSGMRDFFKLFTPDSPWVNASSSVQVFKLYGGWLDRVATLEQLRSIVADLARRGHQVAFEGGPLTPTAACTGTIEGFAGPVEGGHAARRFKEAGGRVDYIDLEHPFDAVTFYDAPAACRFTPEQAARDVALYVKTIRSVFPDARFGAIETANHDPAQVARWVEAYRAVLGEDLSYFSLDVDFHRPSWPQQARAIQEYLEGRGIEFGIFYHGDENATSDADWVAEAERRFVEFEVKAGGRPARVIFQSWNPHPERLIPETDRTVFTWLINRYTRDRTRLSLQGQQKLFGAIALRGTLTGPGGVPVPSAKVDVSMVALSGPGLIGEYTLTGTVPAGALTADVGYRVNTECGCSGESAFTLYGVSFREGKAEANLVPGSGFEKGLEGWSSWGKAGATLAPSDSGGGNALVVRAHPGQDAALNSADFAVHAGAEFTATFRARVAPSSAGSGSFSVVFLGPRGEIRRLTLPIEAGPVPAGSAITDATGAFTLTASAAQSTAEVRWEAWYAGDDGRWPAIARWKTGR